MRAGLRTLVHSTRAWWGSSLERSRSAWHTPQFRAIRFTGSTAVLAAQWKQRLYHPYMLLRVATLRRINAAARLVYYVLPLSPAALAKRLPQHEPSAKNTLAVTPRARLIANPASGTLRHLGALRELEEAVAYLSKHGLPTELRLTERPGHAVELAREAVRSGMDMVIAAGGDGTVNDVIQALAGHETALGVLPLGTVNVWAREVGIPLYAPDACDVLLNGVRRRVDLGQAGSRYFLLMAGIGFDAEVARRVELSKLKQTGLKVLEYLATVGRLSVTHQPTRIWMVRDGKRYSTRAHMVIIGNTRLYGGTMTFTRNAIADDGWLDAVTVGGGGITHKLAVLGGAMLRRKSLGPRVRYDRAKRILLEAAQPLPVQVDGEVIGNLPMTFTVAPQALTVIVPEFALAPLFQKPPLPPTTY
jgi:YegS/Rv2252/BmrU family lipid kinase